MTPTNHPAPESERGALLKQYISDWVRIIYDATGNQTKVDRAILLADLNGMFDPAKFAADAILSRRMGAEPVAWQYRVMYDKGHAREKEWCEWHIISKKYYDIVCVEIASGKQRVQARKLYASPPAPALDARTVEALKNAMTLMEADDKIDAFNGTSSIARTRVLEQCRSALATRAYRGK